jgi:hypothetical protein
MPTLAEIRTKYPQYNDLSDADLTDKLYKKFYSDMPRAEFDQKLKAREADKPSPAPAAAATPAATPASASASPAPAPPATPASHDTSLWSRNPIPGAKGRLIAETLSNVPGSAVKAAKSTAGAFLHPIETAESFADLGKGIAQYLGFKKGTDFEKYPDAVGKYFVERYGGLDRILETIKTDPVGFALDASVVLSGGGGLAARLPGAAGDMGSVIGAVGRNIDPLVGAGKVAKGAAAGVLQPAAKLIGGFGTYTGDKPIQLAFRSGKEGGKARETFLSNLRQVAPKEAIVLDARNAVAQMRKERGQAYRQGMVGVKAQTTPLNFTDVDAAIVDMDKVATFSGRTGAGPTQIISDNTATVRKAIKDAIADWKTLDPAEFHTPEGFDALKKKIGGVRDGTEIGTPARLVADEAYQAVRKTIIKQNPEYAKVMHGYEAATDLITQIEKELTANRDAPIGATLRKLQAVLRDNVATSYGYRAELADVLVNAGAPHLLEAIAGQAMEGWTSRGLGKMLAAGEAAYALTYSHDLHDFMRAVVLLGLSSPRLMGETASALGTASRYGSYVPVHAGGQVAFQAGRMPPITDAAQAAAPQSASSPLGAPSLGASPL